MDDSRPAGALGIGTCRGWARRVSMVDTSDSIGLLTDLWVHRC